MTTVVGGDLSLSATGIVTWRDGRFYVDSVHTPPGMPTPERHHTIVTRLLRMADGPTLYVLEARIDIAPRAEIVDGEAKVTAGRRGDSTLDLAELRGVVNYGIHVRGHARAEVHPLTLKVYATGSGRASKAAMVTAARGRLGRHVHVRDDNEADAAWLVAIALHRYGRPLWSPPRKHLPAVNRPAWPEFTLEEPPS